MPREEDEFRLSYYNTNTCWIQIDALLAAFKLDRADLTNKARVGAAVRAMSGDPMLGEALVMNYRVAELDVRQRAMLDFAAQMTQASATIEEADRQRLRDVGFSDRDIWDIANVAGFFNMTNRVASATDMRPNDEYHAQAR